MSSQSNNRYPSTKFAALSDGEIIASARKNYFLWIITVTLMFIITVSCFSYKLFIAPIILTEQNPIINNTYSVIDHDRNSKLKFYNPDPILKELIKRSQKYRNEFTDKESQTIPLLIIEQILQKNFENIQDFINLDLLLHYESLINKFEVKSLKLIFNEYQSKLLELKKSGDFENFLRGLKSNKFKFYANHIKEQKYNLELEYFENFFALTEELNHWYNYLHRLPDFLSTYEEQKVQENLDKFYCTGINFEKYTEETQKRLFYFAYPFKITEKKLQEINGVINLWSKPITTEFYNCSVILYKKVLLLSDINKEIQKLNASCVKYIYIFASHVIYLDSDLEFNGVNIAIVAPEWLFLKKIKINLNGVNGGEFKNENANINEPGMPGNPGGNAGNFIGIGNPEEKFLIISANGGKGGKGQNGAKGLDGLHYTRPDFPISKPSCISKINTLNYLFGKKVTLYKIFSEFGCGSPGTDGGVGGMGGAGGVITLISDSIKVIKGLNGATGTPGKGGPGGIGGRNGCYYEALDEDNKILHPVTKVKCPGESILPSGEIGKDNYNSKGLMSLPEKENLTVDETLYQFLRFVGEDFVGNNDLKIVSFLKNLNQLELSNKIHVRDAITEYKLLKVFDKIELYEIFKDKILKHIQESQPFLKYLVSALLGKIMILKENVNFFFIDFKNYLNLVERNINITTEQSLKLLFSYFKKNVQDKIGEIKVNLNQIKMKSDFLTSSIIYNGKFFERNNSTYLSELYEKRVSEIMTKTIDVLIVLMTPGNEKQMPFNLLKLLQKNDSISKSMEISTELPISNVEKILLNTLENLQNNNSYKIKNDLSNIKDALSSLKESAILSSDMRNLLETLTDEIEHFIALYSFLEWEEWDRLLVESLVSLTTNPKLQENEEVNFLKNELVDVISTLQCKLTLQYARLNLYSFKKFPTCLQLLQNKSIIINHTNFPQSIACEEADSFCKNHFKAVFDKNSAVGEFYFWANAEIRNRLKNLFSGGKIILRADIVNHHLFDKNFIQFRTLKLEFETGNKSHEHLQEILSNFKIEMLHSGYSYYNWKGDTYVFFSDKVNLEYSFRINDNNEPEIYNSLYKKCQDGEINLSPFTIWTLRLLPVRDAADFSKLIPFIDSVNLRLIGTATYIS